MNVTYKPGDRVAANARNFPEARNKFGTVVRTEHDPATIWVRFESDVNYPLRPDEVSR